MSNSIQFNSDGTVFSNDGTVLNKRTPKSQRPLRRREGNASGIQTKVGGLTTFNSASGPATHRQNATQVQLRSPTGLVKVAGFEVTPEVAQTLTEAAPEMFVDPSVKAQEAALGS